MRIKDEEWNVFRRYSQFLDLHTRLKKVYPIVSKFDFPPKKSMGSKVRTGVGHVCIVHVDRAVADSSSLFSFFSFSITSMCHTKGVIHIDCSVGDSSSLLFFLSFFFFFFFWFVAKHISGGLLFERTIINPLQNPNESYFVLSLMCQPNL